jgi:signal transduction histidine kinase
MEAVSSTSILLEDTDTARRQRAKERFYVLCQTGGWGLFMSLQALSTFLFVESDQRRSRLCNLAIELMVTALGLLLVHFSRRLIERWGWKQLGWRALVPRVLLLSVVLSLLWTVIGYGYCYGIVQLPWVSKYNVWMMATLSVIDGTMLFVGWYCIYFFYHLFDRFNRSEIERLRLVTSVKEAELRALKSQVNPHFIFNSLNSLRALVEENPTRAREAVTQLANLLRYSLQSGQLETVPFEDELSVVNDYLALEQVRHEERLRLRLDVAPETLRLPIPPMLLQTLVENAVKYGISRRAEGGEIAIIARCEGGALRLQVTNPGELTSSSGTARSASTGVGLHNAAERLRLLFGDQATLQVRAATPELVVAEAVVPMQLTRA